MDIEDKVLAVALTILTLAVPITFTLDLASDKDEWDKISDTCAVNTVLERELWFMPGPIVNTNSKKIYCETDILEKKI